MLSPGILFGLGAAFSFSLMALTVKMIGLPAQESILARSILTTIFAFLYMRHHAIAPFGRPENLRLLIVRGFTGYTALCLYFFCLERIPLGEAALIQYTSPVFAGFLSFLFLGEKLSWSHLIGLICGLVGISLLTSFDLAQYASPIPWPYWAACILSSLGSSVAYTLVRSLILRGEEPDVIVFYFSFLSIPLSLVLGFRDFVMPTPWQWVLLGLIGITSHLGQIFLTRSLETAKTAKATGVLYFGALFSAIWGVIFFQEQIGWQLLLGGFLIIGGQLLPTFFLRES